MHSIYVLVQPNVLCGNSPTLFHYPTILHSNALPLLPKCTIITLLSYKHLFAAEGKTISVHFKSKKQVQPKEQARELLK